MKEFLLPSLERRVFKGIPVLTDETLFQSTGVRIAFTGREGGVSVGPYAELNLGSHVGDELADVERNRVLLLEALDASSAHLLVPNQVHGNHVECVRSATSEDICAARENIAEGADGICVFDDGVAALLCYADCTPVIAVSPSGHFAVVHAGWRGAVAGIAGKAVKLLAQHCDPAHINIYIGPHIRSECFETGEEVTEQFEKAFGEGCAPDSRHVSLADAVSIDVQREGVLPQRIVDAGICTKCSHEEYYSYRANAGVCGRHGAIAVRV